MMRFLSSLFFVFIVLTTHNNSKAYAVLGSGMDADIVLGQPDFKTSSGGTTPSKSTLPYGVASDGKRFFAAELTNHRVLIWNTIPTSIAAPADVVLGQPNFTQAVANNGGRSARTFNLPGGVSTDGLRLFVSDVNNHRVLIWNTIPTTNQAAADVVLGQATFATAASGTTQSALNGPIGLFSDGKKLYVADTTNNRILIWNSIPTANNTPADIVLGQDNFLSANLGVSSNSLSGPYSVFVNNQKLYVIDTGNHRVLIWNKIPTTNRAPADIVLSQPNFTTSASGLSQNSLNTPRGGCTDGRRLFVGDGNNRRLLVWSSIPHSNFTPPDVVLGQLDFNTNAAATAANRTALLISCAVDGKNLYVSDHENNRVLVFNLGESFGIKLGPQFEQGKGVLGKVFWDANGNGIQNDQESGMEGVKVVSDTGIYAITDEDGKYHFPFIETGQRVLKIDKDTLPEDSEITTDNPYKVVVTEGVLTKVSFGVRQRGETSVPEASREESNIVLKVSVSQESSELKPRLGVSVEMGKEKQEGKFVFTIDCNYFLFIKRSELKIYDQDQKLIKTLELPQPLPLYYELPSEEITPLLRATEEKEYQLYYQVSVYDSKAREDRTSLGSYRFTRYQELVS